MDRRTTSRGVSQVPAVLRLRVDASICATEPNTPAPHGDLDRWPKVALYCSRRKTVARLEPLALGRPSLARGQFRTTGPNARLRSRLASTPSRPRDGSDVAGAVHRSLTPAAVDRGRVPGRTDHALEHWEMRTRIAGFRRLAWMVVPLTTALLAVPAVGMASHSGDGRHPTGGTSSRPSSPRPRPAGRALAGEAHRGDL